MSLKLSLRINLTFYRQAINFKDEIIQKTQTLAHFTMKLQQTIPTSPKICQCYQTRKKKGWSLPKNIMTANSASKIIHQMYDPSQVTAAQLWERLRGAFYLGDGGNGSMQIWCYAIGAKLLKFVMLFILM